MVGFCTAEEKEFGPLQLYVPAGTSAVVKLKVCPVQTGPLLLRTGVADAPFTTTDPVPVGPTQPDTVAKTEYVPALIVPAPTITGFCEAEEKLLGPDQE